MANKVPPTPARPRPALACFKGGKLYHFFVTSSKTSTLFRNLKKKVDFFDTHKKHFEFSDLKSKDRKKQKKICHTYEFWDLKRKERKKQKQFHVLLMSFWDLKSREHKKQKNSDIILSFGI